MRARLTILAMTVAGIGLTLGAAGRAQTTQAPADLVLTNGAVLTVDPRDSVAEAVAITGGRIVAVGTTRADQALTSERPPRSWTWPDEPSLPASSIPTCISPRSTRSSTSTSSDVAIKSMDDVLKRIAAQVAKLKPGEWVRGRGWDEGKLAERRYITAADLDKVAPNNPVWLTHTTGHYGVANSYAMKMAEVRRGTKDPPAGTIDRDTAGNPTGVMKESAPG